MAATESCSPGDSSCPENTMCTNPLGGNKYWCLCSLNFTRSSTGQCLAPGENGEQKQDDNATGVTQCGDQLCGYKAECKQNKCECSSSNDVLTYLKGTSPSLWFCLGTNSAALTAGLVVGLGGTIVLAVIVLVVVVRKRKRKSGDGTGNTSMRPSVEQITANAAYSNVSVSDSRGQDNAACSTAIAQTGTYEEVDLDRNSGNKGVDVAAAMEYTSPQECNILCDLKTTHGKESSIQPEMYENTKAFYQNVDSAKQNEYQVLYDVKNTNKSKIQPEQNQYQALFDLKTTNESQSRIQPGSQSPKVFQKNVDSAKQNEYQVLYDVKNTNKSKIQPEQNQYQALFDLKTTNKSQSRIQPGSQSPKVFQKNVDSAKQNEYQVLYDVKNTNESKIQPEQNQYQALFDLKTTNE
ncbi:uncharacterized protein LOC135481476 [Liolophura sinensis]|uniref:uncharacterized protein LOC135481476 n=1 Tax=Liolophura sinensis TaxID=3198878 RepID=UPI0031598563